MTEARAQTAVALSTLAGSFAVILTALLTNRPIPDSVMTLITVAQSAVLGWYFGVRGAASGAATVNDAHANTVAAVTAATAAAHDMATGAPPGTSTLPEHTAPAPPGSE